jgi:hypothetical protein
VARIGAAARREAILKATCREVIARGFGSTRVADVAGALGISTGLQWKETVARVIGDGVAAGECSCPDRSATAWRLTALLDGLAVQVVVHRGVLRRRELLAWVRTAAASELGLDPVSARDGLSRGRAAGGGAAARLAGHGGSA